MSKPFLGISDLHFHNWNSFASIDENGVNSRLQIQINEVKRAVGVLKAAGGNLIINAGDTFHVRGKVETTVLNPVVDLFRWILDQGVDIVSIPGNHDLAGKEADEIGNAVMSLRGSHSDKFNTISMVIGNEPIAVNDLGLEISHDSDDIIMFPWRSSLNQLKEELERYAHSDTIAVIHAPVNGVIMGIPDHGLDAEYLGKLGYKYVLAGHYHNHKDFGNGVHSIGAMCHQTWSDLDSKAGFLMVDDNGVKWHASHAPAFVEIYGDMDEEELLICDGNYVRAKIGKATPAQINELRQELTDRGAKGVVIQAVKESEVEARSSGVTQSVVSLGQSVIDYIGSKYAGSSELTKLCQEILSETEEVE